VATCSAEMWVMHKSGGKTLMTFERKTLRKIFGEGIEDSQWRKRRNVEPEKLCKGVNIDIFMELQGLR
jgi:hypothetical protein